MTTGTRRAALTVAALAAALTFAVGQEADPLRGATVAALGTFTPGAAPERSLQLLRITLEPGTTIPEHRHPGAVVVEVEEGVFGTTFAEGEGTIQRSEGEVESVAAGESATLQAGDSLAYEGALHTMANEGDETLILVVAALLDPNQPGFMFEGMDMDGEDDGQDGDGQDGESG
ncbi:MAG TPA: cupin domain-containing protein [Trueperaceae bacterium]